METCRPQHFLVLPISVAPGRWAPSRENGAGWLADATAQQHIKVQSCYGNCNCHSIISTCQFGALWKLLFFMAMCWYGKTDEQIPYENSGSVYPVSLNVLSWLVKHSDSYVEVEWRRHLLGEGEIKFSYLPNEYLTAVHDTHVKQLLFYWLLCTAQHLMNTGEKNHI